MEEKEKIIEIEIERLKDFKEHPFQVKDDEEMRQLKDSISEYGVLNPLIVRPRPEGVYEIISGHRRKYASQKLGYVYVNKELQRVTKEALKELDGKDVLLVFPEKSKINKTVRILKTPKTETSVRKIFLPKSVAIMLQEWKAKQEEAKEVLGSEYQDFNLVMATTFGHPTDGAAIRNDLKKLIQEYDLPPVVFHSLRHTSVTYKLKLNGGDIKAVQGDSGHAQVNMVTDVYSHILDDDRKKNAELFEDAFYGKKETDPQMHRKKPENTLKVPEGVDAELLAKVLSNPEMAALLASLAKTIK